MKVQVSYNGQRTMMKAQMYPMTPFLESEHLTFSITLLLLLPLLLLPLSKRSIKSSCRACIIGFLYNIVYYHIAANGWIITGDAIIQLYMIHEA